MPLLANVKKVLESGDYILFLGAGVGVEAGLGTWPTALNEIADLLPPSANYLAAPIKQEVTKNRFLEAAEFLYLADLTDTERYEILKKVFDKPVKLTTRLRALMKANYQAIVTTNYDRSLIACATDERIQLTQYANTSEDFSAATVPSDRFIMRLHGRVEVPSAIVLAKRHYEKLKQDVYYKRFIERILEHHNIVFFGFSFADPHLYEIVKTFSEITNGYVSRSGYALFAASPQPELKAILDKANIKSVVYDPSAEHEAAWNLFPSLAARKVVDINAHEEDVVRRRLAATLAHLRLKRDISAVDQLVESILLSILREKNKGLAKKTLIQSACNTYQRVANRTGQIEAVVARLVREGTLQIGNDEVVTIVPSGDSPDNLLEKIIDGVIDIAKVRYNLEPKNKPATKVLLSNFLVQVLAEDGMLVAHSLTSRSALRIERIDKVVEKCLAVTEHTAKSIIQPFIKAILIMIEKPEPIFQKMLDYVASVTFAIATLTSDPNIISNAKMISSSSIYLDASIIIPWLAYGHPAAAAYDRIVTGMSSTPPIIPEFYINEIVSHRTLAISESKEINLDDTDVLRRYLTFHGSHSVNAYIAGYGGLKQQKGYTKTFSEYLEEFAPFSTDAEAISFLRKKGLIIQPLQLARPGESPNIPHIKYLIKDELEKVNVRRHDVRIEHDAMMVVAMRYMSSMRQDKYIFVTADRRLIGVVSSLKFDSIAEKMLLPHQAITLTQINSNSIETVSGLSKLIWNVRHDDITRIEEFYRDRVLQEYEPALLEGIDTIVNSIVDEISKTTHFGIDNDDHEFQDRVQEFKAMEQYEDLFHKKMDAERQRVQKLMGA